MSEWLERNKDRVDYTVNELKKLYYMNIDTGDLNLNGVIFLINSMAQEVSRLSRERDSYAQENEKLKEENRKLEKENDQIKNENSSF